MSICPHCSYPNDPGYTYVPGSPCSNCGHCETSTEAPEESRGVVLRLVPPAPADSRANCRKILLETLTRVENGEVDELVLATVNSKQSPNPYTLRWQMTDPVRIIGLLGVMHVRFSGAPFVTMT